MWTLHRVPLAEGAQQLQADVQMLHQVACRQVHSQGHTLYVNLPGGSRRSKEYRFAFSSHSKSRRWPQPTSSPATCRRQMAPVVPLQFWDAGLCRYTDNLTYPAPSPAGADSTHSFITVASLQVHSARWPTPSPARPLAGVAFKRSQGDSNGLAELQGQAPYEAPH